MRFFFCFFVLVLSCWGKEPDILYLSWLHDPTTTMTIQWHTPKDEDSSAIEYKKSEGVLWQTIKGSAHEFSNSKTLVHTVELKNLSPDALYDFRIKDTVYHFKTLPQKLHRPLRFVVAGDAYYYLSLFRKMNQQIAKKEPDFIVVGGDMAYTEGVKSFFSNLNWKVRRWQTFLMEWKKQMITSDGRLIPLIAVLGNHDIRKKENSPLYFFELFAMPQEKIAYRSLTYGDYLSLVLLDTGHYSPIAGDQTKWLEETLEKEKSYPYKLAVYHVGAYPSVYKYDRGTPPVIRKHWMPLFDKYKLHAGFEHHSHSFKRTHRIKGGRVDPEGVLYLGDGSWGVPPRATFSPAKTWYLAKAKKVDAFWLVTLETKKILFQAYDNKGKLIDEVFR